MRREPRSAMAGLAPTRNGGRGTDVENGAFVSPASLHAAGRQAGADSEGTRLPEESYFRDVVRAVRAGETARFEEIVNLFRDRVHRMAWRMAHDGEDALDITQEVFLRAFHALGSWHGRARFSTWLHRIVINASIDFMRKRSRQQRSTESIEAMEPERRAAIEARHAPHDQPRRLAYAGELRREILAAVQRLPRRQRECFLLRYYHESSIREVAAVLKISQGAVKRHLHRAARRLRTDLSARLGPVGG